MTTLPEAASVLTAPATTLKNGPRLRWGRFFLILFPVALLSLGVVLQVAAYALRGIQPFRTSLDTMAVAVEQVPGNASWLIFSDSLTQHILMDYNLGPADQVANLTTHAGAGMPSIYLLLNRYLKTHAAPKSIMLAMSVEAYARIPDQKNGAYWLIGTFLKPQEQAWLAQFYPTSKASDWMPAAFDVKSQVLDPLTGAFAPKRNHLIVGPREPTPGIPVEAARPVSPAGRQADAKRMSERLELSSTRPILADICRVAKQHNITVHLLVAPMTAEVRKAYVERGDIQRMTDQARTLMTQECGAFTQFDMSAVLQPGNFDDDGTHLVDLGWENAYALALKIYMDGGAAAVQAASGTILPKP